jgi:6-phosphogluconolactonase (cycloisomerase 2 family)
MQIGRRQVLGMMGAAGAGCLLRQAQAGEQARTVYLGSFSSSGRPRGRGLEIGAVDPASGQLTVSGPVAGVADASFLALSPDRRTLYTTNEIEQGTLTAFAIGSDAQRPVFINKQSSRGRGPTHLSVHPGGAFLFTANYGDGTVAVHPLETGGRIGEATHLVEHRGEAREPHAHQVLTDPSENWVVAVDLGADYVYVYGLDLSNGTLTLNEQLKLPAGAGPRHLAFHPGGRFAYILGELRSEITVAAWDAGAGRFTPGQVIGTLGGADATRNFPAEIAVSADGRFVYASNRKHASIALFAVEDAGARLVFRGTTPTGGAWPRHFTLDPAGDRLYAANQKSNSVTWLPRNPDTGKLGGAAGSATVNNVGMILFV